MPRGPQRVSEPREKSFKFNFDDIALPAIIAGGLVVVAVYKDQVAELITKGIPNFKEFLDSLKLYPLPNIPPPTGGGGGGGGGGGSIPAGTTVWTSSSWGNGKSRSISAHQQKDPYDSRLYIAAGSGRKGTFPGNGTAILQGDQSRFYLLANNYNSSMMLTARANKGLSNLSLKLRSRHNEGGSTSNRFGGYGVAFHFDSNEIDCKREDYHNVHTGLGTCKPGQLSYGRDYNLGMSCQDNGRQVFIGAYMDGRRVCTFTDKSPKDYMINKSLYNQKSYSWIRTNGGGSVTLKNVVVKEIGPVSGANVAYAYPTFDRITV